MTFCPFLQRGRVGNEIPSISHQGTKQQEGIEWTNFQKCVDWLGVDVCG
jgi:hypothetical protein